MITSWEAYRHFLVFFLGVEDDDKPLSSSLSLEFFSSNAKDDDKPKGSQLIVISWFFFLGVEDDDELANLLSSFGFFHQM
jgi:hypothetical protein